MANTGGTRDLLDITSGDFLKGTGASWNFDFANTGSVGWYKLVDWTGTTNFVASDFTFTNLAPGLLGDFVVDNATSALYINVFIPEPSTWAALIIALIAAFLLRRKKSCRA